ncbi:hypothetical protein [Sorangium sp. So ce388]|uniref:hypothetical protein n=1 Tax=Sorangium sp. So ce388 TaxID=3133309 RepID=UPI003F5BA1B3
MTNRNANKSSPGQPAGQGSAGDPAPQPQPQQPPMLPQQPPRGYDAPNFLPQEHPSLAQQRALSQDPRRRPDEGALGPAAPPAERAMPWGEPRPRRRQDREAGPSDKQVYVPPVTLPPNREHQAMDLQKIQVAPSLLKGVDERNRPTMRRIPVHGIPGAPEGQGGARPGGVRTARVGVGSGVWPPPEETSRKQRPHAAPVPQPVAAAPRAGVPPQAAQPDPAAAAAAAALAARRRGAPLGLFALLVFLGSATVAGFWVLWRAANPPSRQDATLAEDVRGPAPEPGVVTPAPSALPEQPPPATPPPVATEQPPPVAEPSAPAATGAPSASAAVEPSPSSAHAGPVAAARPPAARPAPQVKRPSKPPTTPEDPYESTASNPIPPQPLPSAPAASPSAPPGTTAPPRPFP